MASSSRIYYWNLLTQATFETFVVTGTAVSMWPYSHTPFYLYRAGKAGLEVRGTYTHPFELDYLAEIHICADGTFANSRWRWSDSGGGTWNAQNLTPVHGVWVLLSHGIEIRWLDTTGTAGTPQFVLGDFFESRALRPFGVVKVLDGSRNTEYRSGAMATGSSVTLWWDMGVALLPQFLGVLDHNIPTAPNATITLLANTTPAAGGASAQPVTWRDGHLAEIVTLGSFRYWGLRVSLVTQALTYLRLSTLFLGWGGVFRNPCDIGMTENEEFLGSLDITNYSSRGPHPMVLSTTQPQRTWSGVKRGLLTEDGGLLDAALAYAQAHASETILPFFFVPLDSDLSQIEYNSWISLSRTNMFLDRWVYQPGWIKVIRTVAS